MSWEMFTFLLAYLIVGGALLLFGAPPLLVWLATPVVAYMWREVPPSTGPGEPNG